MEYRTLSPRTWSVFRSDQSVLQSPDFDDIVKSIGNMNTMEMNQMTNVEPLGPQHPSLLLKGYITPVNLFKVIVVKVNIEAAMAIAKQ